MKRTFQPSNLVRKRRHGFRSRMATKGGRLFGASARARAQAPFSLNQAYETRPASASYAASQAGVSGCRKRRQAGAARIGFAGALRSPIPN